MLTNIAESMLLAVNLSDDDARRSNVLQTVNCERCWQKQECSSQDGSYTERRKYAPPRISLWIGQVFSSAPAANSGVREEIGGA